MRKVLASVPHNGVPRRPNAARLKHRRPHALVVLGTRPEAIKLAPVIHELLQRPLDFGLSVCATGQHRLLLDQVMRSFRLPVHYDLRIMTSNQALDKLTARILVRVAEVLRRAQPDVILVQGDTTTTLGATLAGFYQRIPVAHVEAGLRTQDRYAPFPEEINRRLTSQMADYHFAPTEWARNNLLREGIRAQTIFVTGNTVVDAFLTARDRVLQHPPAIPSLNGLDWKQRRLVLVTAHRRENFGPPLESICYALRQLALSRADLEIVYPVHPNPNVRGTVWRLLSGIPRVHLLEPLEYLPFVWLMTQAYLVLTDSGGIQEEMPSLRRPVLVLREKTERPEGLEAGVCQLVGTDSASIQSAVVRLLDDKRAYRQFARRRNPFGDGKAARRIVNHLARVVRPAGRQKKVSANKD